MSVKDSNLSDPHYGYDFVVATTQASINATMKEYLSETTLPVVTVYYNQDDQGNPVEVDRATLMAQTSNTDPFSVPAWNEGNPVTQDIINLSNSNFWYGFRAQIGLPPGYEPQNIPDIVTLNPGAESITFNLMCSQFSVVETNFGRRGLVSYVNVSQPSGDAWLFTSTIPLKSIINNNNLPPTVQRQLDNLGPDAFSVQQLLFDIDNAALESSPTISGVDPGSAILTALNQAFSGAYFSAMKQGSQPVLGYTITPNNPGQYTSSLDLTSMNFEVSPYTPPPSESSNPDLNTLNYLCATANKALPPAVQFQWNWIDPPAQYDGVVAINRNTFAAYFREQLTGIVSNNCYLPSVHVEATGGFSSEFTFNLAPGQPSTATITPTGAKVLTFTYTSPPAYDQAGLGGDLGSMSLSSNFNVDVTFQGTNITITQNLIIYADIVKNWDSTKGNVVNMTLTDTYTISVDQEGKLSIGKSGTSKLGNNPSIEDTSGFMNAFNNLNQHLHDLENYASKVVSTNLTDIPVSALQNFIFPGGNTFAFANVSFSDNQDLVACITYTDPSS